MNSFDQAFKADKETAEVPIGNGIAIEIKRAGSQNAKFKAQLTAFEKKYRRRIDKGLIDDEVVNAKMAKLVTDTLVVSWSGVKEFDTKSKEAEVPYSKEKCIDVLMQYPEIINMILAEAQEIENFKVEDAEEIVGK